MLIFIGLLALIATVMSTSAVRAVVPSESFVAGLAVAGAVFLLWQGGMLG